MGRTEAVLTHEAVAERALRYCDLAVAQGLLAVRSHVDVCDDRLLAVEALLAVKKTVAPYLDLQLVAFPQDGYFRAPAAAANLEARARPRRRRGRRHSAFRADDGRRRRDGESPVRDRRRARTEDRPALRRERRSAVAPRRDARLEAQRLGLGARATGSHLTSMHSMDNYYVSKLLPLIAESGINAIANPLINITLQGRHDTYPRRRGLTRIAEMRALGVPRRARPGLRDGPGYGLGGADMLDVAHMAVHAAPMTSREAIRWSFDAVTEIPARILGLDGYGLAVGAYADMVVLQAADPIEAVRLRAPRLAVIRRGKVIAKRRPRVASLSLPGRPQRARSGRLRAANLISAAVVSSRAKAAQPLQARSAERGRRGASTRVEQILNLTSPIKLIVFRFLNISSQVYAIFFITSVRSKRLILV